MRRVLGRILATIGGVVVVLAACSARRRTST